jgi:hypothetical protein
MPRIHRILVLVLMAFAVPVVAHQVYDWRNVSVDYVQITAEVLGGNQTVDEGVPFTLYSHHYG